MGGGGEEIKPGYRTLAIQVENDVLLTSREVFWGGIFGLVCRVLYSTSTATVYSQVTIATFTSNLKSESQF